MNAFGKVVTYSYKSGQSLQINAIFDDVYRPYDPITGMDAGDSGVVASRVVMGIRLDDLPDKPDNGDCIMLDNLTYYVQEVQVDGQGGAHLVLNYAEA